MKRILAGSVFLLLLAGPAARADEIRPQRVTGDFQDPAYAADGRIQTRATTGTPRYQGRALLLDLGYETVVEGVIQDHGSSSDDYPLEYRVEISREARPYQTVFEGRGSRGQSVARFSPTLGRYIRLTATRDRNTFNWWSISELRVVVRQTARSDPSGARISGDLQDLAYAIDGNDQTRATTNSPNYAGRSITLDLGGEYEISKVTQIHSPSDGDYPALYKVEASRDNSRWREVYRGAGTPSRSVAEFNDRDVRYIRITALDRRNGFNWWSIHELIVKKGRDAAGWGGDRDNNRDDDEGRGRLRQVVSARGNGLNDAGRSYDGNMATRATTGTPNYAGSWITFDLGGDYEISRVVQRHDGSPNDFPARYKIEVSRNGATWREVYHGRGQPQRSIAEFPTVRGRYVRITAIDRQNNSNWWSIHEIRIRE